MFKKAMLVDTDVIIDLLRGQQEVKPIFEDIENGKVDAAFSTITEVELFSGKSCNSLEEQQKIDALLLIMKRLPLNKSVAREAGRIKRKQDTNLADAVIAATAIANHIKIIVTRNKKHFNNIKELRIEAPG